ncbi:DUF3311 domain-containing protein [Amycolatopsis sp. AA4]|uniref:DUF3311 domain-containing protein n=1 Tax=Actinomycetes TaxID=1760 RepID=UPI0001B54054|nr:MULTISPECIES: DUF3311 domain-containing protein [Actinomycetes]ATY13434.1 DUF3311 domain-containing protein [Amycolatopsis sp. AA4]
MIGSRWSLVLALGLPGVAIFVGVPLCSQSTVTVFGIPLVFAWLFAWLPLTTLCLWASWRFFDRAQYRRVEGGEE